MGYGAIKKKSCFFSPGLSSQYSKTAHNLYLFDKGADVFIAVNFCFFYFLWCGKEVKLNLLKVSIDKWWEKKTNI